MKNVSSIFLFSLFCLLILSAFTDKSSAAYWDTQHKGANIFNQKMTPEIWQDAKKANITLVRLATDKWKGQSRDFLIGNADDYRRLVASDVSQLKKVLDDANRNNVKVVLTMLSLPGSRWKQLNDGRDDTRLWRDSQYQDQAIQFWKALAAQLKNHPAIVGYNILNEPHPETIFGYSDFSKVDQQKITKQISEPSLACLSAFYQKIVAVIREVDAQTPIVLDVGMYADPRSFVYFKPINDKNVLYSFHMYEPFAYTNKKLNNGKYSFPGMMLLEKDSHQLVRVDKETLETVYFDTVRSWQKKYNVSSNKILVGEFGGNRATKGLDHYFADLISIFDRNSWHWLFYSFREDSWDGMDYELGNKPLGAKYWDAIAKGEKPIQQRSENNIWNVLESSLKKSQSKLTFN